jgi:hypothetical protein
MVRFFHANKSFIFSNFARMKMIFIIILSTFVSGLVFGQVEPNEETLKKLENSEDYVVKENNYFWNKKKKKNIYQTPQNLAQREIREKIQNSPRILAWSANEEEKRSIIDKYDTYTFKKGELSVFLKKNKFFN